LKDNELVATIMRLALWLGLYLESVEELLRVEELLSAE
jgi:hypothetical protein